jgi:glycosyltransferase involved in cell wall biosynthesis
VQRFLPPASRGGVGHFTHGLARTLVERGHAVTVFSDDSKPADARYECMTLLDGAAGRVQRRLAPLTFPFRVARCDFSGFDLIHAQGDDQWIPRGSAPPVVRTLHGSSLSEAMANGWRRASPKHFLLHLYFYLGEYVAHHRADAVAAVSRGAERHFARQLDVVPNAIDLERFAPQGRGKSRVPAILFVGALASRKRGHLLLKAVQKWVRPEVPDVQVWIVGPDRIQESWVECFGEVDDDRLAELYETAWVLCLPSSYEGFGRPYLEAMAAGTAVVATPNPGALDVLDNGRYGLIVQDRDLGPALCRLLVDHEERAHYARVGLTRVKEYAWGRVADRYEQIYERVLSRRARRARA